MQAALNAAVYKADEGNDLKAPRIVAALEAAARGVAPEVALSVADMIGALQRTAAPSLPPGARRRMLVPMSAASDYLIGAAHRGPLVEAVTVEPGALPHDVVEHAGFSPAVAAIAVEEVRWEGVGAYVASRLGPLAHVIDGLRGCDRLRFANVGIDVVLTTLPEAAKIERLNLPISGYEKALHLVSHKDGTRTLVLGDFRGRSFMEHFQMLVRARLNKRLGAPPSVGIIESPSLFRQRTLDLRDFFRAHAAALNGVGSVVVAYPDVFASSWKGYAVGTVVGDGPGRWRADLYLLPGGKRVAVLSSPGDFYGDLLGQELRALVDDVPAIRRVFFAGSGGSLHARTPYTLVLPSRAVGSAGASVDNVLSSGSGGLTHESALSPLAETPSFVAAAQRRQVSTVDMEIGGIADALSGTGVEVGFGVVVTDFPAGQIGDQKVRLASQSPRGKQDAAAVLPAMIERFLASGAQTHDHPLETALGATIASMSAQNLERRLASLGVLSADEQALFDRVAALEPTYAMRIPAGRLPRLIEGGLMSKRQVATLLGQKVTPFTPDSEDQLYGAFDYTFGTVGFHDGDETYGDVVVRLRRETVKGRAWASHRAGIHATAAARCEGPVSRAALMISGRAGARLDPNDPAQREQLTRARELFSTWVVSANDAAAELAVQAVEGLRRADGPLRQSLLSAHGDALRKVLRDARLVHLEGRIRGALTLADVESVAVPKETPAAFIDALRDRGVAVETAPGLDPLSPRSVVANLKSWLFVRSSTILDAEARAETATAPQPHLTPSQRRSARARA
ncbi:MAG: hypothetical protein HYV07_20635 [Deltaproteobacteria bacterium]|nr:hypothetical protein [Deltaproteobacteria bacterium]